MKSLLTLYILLFSPLVFAKNISDFEIEGMSVGDSLLDYYSENEIKESSDANVYDSDKFNGKIIKIKIKQYDELRVIFKKEDNKKYIIDSIGGRINFKKNINDCFLKQDEIINSISNIIKNISWNRNQFNDADGTYLTVYSNIEYGSVSVTCYDWKKELETKYGWWDMLQVGLDSYEYISDVSGKEISN